MNVDIKHNVYLKDYTTFRVGGVVRFFAKARNWQTILALREFAKKQGVPYMVLGGGSNVLFSDEGYPGLVILNQMNQVHFQQDTVTAEAGVTWVKLLAKAAEKNLGGLSAFCNVPGTIGGAVYGNAGLPQLCMADVLLNATILPANGNRPMIVGQDYAQFGYRTSHFKTTKDIILSATMQLKPMPKALIKQEVSGFVKMRVRKQPAGLTCGSFFKNPARFPSAGWLIEQSGCKGMQLGSAQVSTKHANFFMNTGDATASDIINLALKVQKTVKEKYDIGLEPEVQIYPKNPFRID